MDHPLYGAAMYLNPGKLHPLLKKDDDATVGQLRGCFLDVLARMEDEETRSKINAQACWSMCVLRPIWPMYDSHIAILPGLAQ